MEGAPEYEIIGRLYKLLPVIRYGRRQVKQQFILLTETPTPQMLLMEVTEALIDQLRSYPPQVRLKVRFTIEGRLWHPPHGEARPVMQLRAIELERLTD
ncbi:MAG: DUF3127 domain-containing protein [Bacteroidia bacterium]|nr:DUF3127 domain-containing protein [Bacteroidia bacterium]MDW8015559.1 DUF3127 domain-containing protein [Bacteroidia bacterium]